MAKQQLTLPAGLNTVRVRMIDTSCALSIRADSFIAPTVPGQDYLDVVDQCFLIEHEPTGSKIMFDLGVRKDYWNLPPVVLHRLSLGVAVRSLSVPRDVPEVLASNGISVDEISAVIWSHYHWDHIGNMALFPSTTSLVVGPGFQMNQNVMPGYPENATSPVPSEAFAGRNVDEIDFSTTLTIGGFRAQDYFGDGSFYLLDTPGHCNSHICGLARTTGGQESTFVFLGGDICHSAGCFRPSTTFPLPTDVVSRYFCGGDCSVKSGHDPMSFHHNHVEAPAVEQPLYRISTSSTSAYVEQDVAQNSVEKLVAFDAAPAVLVLIAHDPSLSKYLPTLNEKASTTIDLNGWQKNDWKNLCRWNWLKPEQFDGEVRPKPTGFWRDGTLWSDAQHDLALKSAGAEGSGL